MSINSNRVAGDTDTVPFQAINTVADAMGHGLKSNDNILTVIASVQGDIEFARNLKEKIWVDLVHKIGAARTRYARSESREIKARDHGQLPALASAADRMLQRAGEAWDEATFQLYFNPQFLGEPMDDSNEESESEGEMSKDDDEPEAGEIEVLTRGVDDVDISAYDGDNEM